MDKNENPIFISKEKHAELGRVQRLREKAIRMLGGEHRLKDFVKFYVKEVHGEKFLREMQKDHLGFFEQSALLDWEEVSYDFKKVTLRAIGKKTRLPQC